METKKMNMVMNILKYGLVGIGVIACILVIGGPNADGTIDKEIVEAFRDGMRMSLAVNYTIAIIGITIALVLLFFFVQLITNPKKTVMSIIGIIIALLLFVILWAMGTEDTNESLALLEDVQVAQGTINSTSAGLWTVLIGIVVGVLVAVLSPFMGKYRK